MRRAQRKDADRLVRLCLYTDLWLRYRKWLGNTTDFYLVTVILIWLYSSVHIFFQEKKKRKWQLEHVFHVSEGLKKFRGLKKYLHEGNYEFILFPSHIWFFFAYQYILGIIIFVSPSFCVVRLFVCFVFCFLFTVSNKQQGFWNSLSYGNA